MCVQFVFSAAALHFLVRQIFRLKATPSLHFFCEKNPEPRMGLSDLASDGSPLFPSDERCLTLQLTVC